MTSTKAYPRLCTCILPSRSMCVVCVCYGEVAASISSLANWCMLFCIYMYICKCTNVRIKIVWVWPIPSSKHLESCFLVSASSAAAPSDRLLLLGLKGLRERSLWCQRQHVSLSPLRTSTSAGRVWLRSGVRPLPDSTHTPRWAWW